MKTYLTLLAAALASAQLASGSTEIVSHDFGGDGTGTLNGNTADTFAAGITTAGGSNIWEAGANFRDDGHLPQQASGRIDQSAFLNMGSYINDSRGTANGLFTLSVTMTQTVGGSWAGVTFFESNTPDTGNHFVNNGGMGTIIYRSRENDNLSAFGGPGSNNGSGNLTVTGDQTLTMVLDLTPAGGYNGEDNFGTITFFNGATQVGSSFTHTQLRDFGAIGLTTAGLNPSAETTFSDFSFTQISEPAGQPFALNITPNAQNPGNYDFSWESQDNKLYDLVRSLDLATHPDTWPVWQGNENIAGTAPTNTLVDIDGGGDTKRFFVMVEKDTPPLLSE